MTLAAPLTCRERREEGRFSMLAPRISFSYRRLRSVSSVANTRRVEEGNYNKQERKVGFGIPWAEFSSFDRPVQNYCGILREGASWDSANRD